MKKQRILGFLTVALVLASCQNVTGPTPAPAAQTSRAAGGTLVFSDDFTGTALDTSKWLVAKRQWGGTDVNGGVLPEDVSVANGYLVLTAHGDNYTGPIRGINKDGTLRADGKRTGACVATVNYYSSGSIEYSAKVIPRLGVCSATWTFSYQEVPKGDPQYKGTGAYYVVNHEIDIEIPGRPGSAKSGFDFNQALCNTWIGENDGEYLTGYQQLGKRVDDGVFHTYKIDWHTGSPTEAKRVDFYLDGVKVRTNTDYVPSIAGRFWIGPWFPSGWTGTPAFDTDAMLVDWVKISTYNEPGDQFIKETYPDTGWSVTPAADTQAPTTPAGLAAPSKTGSTVTLSWNASTDNTGVSLYQVFRNGASVGSTSATSFTDSGLTANTAYSYTVKAIDFKLNNSAASTALSVTTGSGSADTQAPTVPSALAASNVTASSLTLTWTASTDNVGVTGYNVFRNGTKVGTSTTASYSDTGLAASTAYSYTVSAYDAAGNTSAVSTAKSVTTSAASGDTQAPTVPSALAASNVTASSLTLTWTASTDNVGVAGYNVFRNGTKVGTSTAASYSDTGLAASTAYSYTVSAYDAAGNTSAVSTAKSVTTSAASGSGNLMTNPGFETGSLSGWTTASGTPAVVTGNAKAGTYSLKLTPSATVICRAEQVVTVLPSTKYTLTGWIKSTGSYGYVGVDGFGEAGGLWSAFTQASYTFTTGAAQTTVKVYASAWNEQTAPVYFDDLSLTKF